MPRFQHLAALVATLPFTAAAAPVPPSPTSTDLAQTYLARCPVDALSCELAGAFATPATLGKWCREGNSAACVVEAVMRAERLPLRRTKAAATKVLDEACAKGMVAACSLRGKHTVPDAEVRKSGASDPHDWRVIGERDTASLKAACAALEPVACELLGDERKKAAFEASCAAGNPVACMRTEARPIPTERLVALCRAGAGEACTEVDPELPAASGAELSRVLTRQCFDGNGLACASALDVLPRVADADKLCAAAREACGAGFCGAAANRLRMCRASRKDAFELLVGQEENCLRFGQRCADAAETHLRGVEGLRPDRDEALFLALTGCDLGFVDACRVAKRLGVTPKGWAAALVRECQGWSCRLADEVETDPATFRGRDDVRSALASSCRMHGNDACRVAARFAGEGLWRADDTAFSLDMHANACFRGDRMSCSLLDVAAVRGDATAPLAAERACQAGRTEACALPGVPPQPRVVETIPATGPESFSALAGGYLILLTQKGFRAIAPGAARPVAEVPVLSSAETRYERPGQWFQFGTQVLAPTLFMRDGALVGIACASRVEGTRWTSGVAIWGARPEPVFLPVERSGRACRLAVRPDGRRAWVSFGTEQELFQGMREIDLERGEFVGPTLTVPGVQPAAVSADGARMLVFHGEDWRPRGRVSLLDTKTGALAPLGELPADGIAELRADGRRALVGGSESPVGIWSLEGATPVLLTSLGRGDAAAFSPDGTVAAVITHDGARLFDAETGAFRSPRIEKVGAPVRFTPDGRFVAFGGRGTTIVALDGRSSWPKPQPLPSRVKQVAPPSNIVRPELELRPPISFVVRENGAPVAGAAVEAVPARDYARSEDSKTAAKALKPWRAVSDANGVVSVSGLPGAVYDVTITSPTGRTTVTIDTTSFDGDRTFYLR